VPRPGAIAFEKAAPSWSFLTHTNPNEAISKQYLEMQA